MSTTIPKSRLFRFENAWLLWQSFLPSILPAWVQARKCSDAAGQLAACLKSTRTATKVWSRRFRVPHQLIANCKFLIQLFDTLRRSRLCLLISCRHAGLVLIAFHRQLRKKLHSGDNEASFGRSRKGTPTLCSTMRKQPSACATTTFDTLKFKAQ